MFDITLSFETEDQLVTFLENLPEGATVVDIEDDLVEVVVETPIVEEVEEIEAEDIV